MPANMCYTAHQVPRHPGRCKDQLAVIKATFHDKLEDYFVVLKDDEDVNAVVYDDSTTTLYYTYFPENMDITVSYAPLSKLDHGIMVSIYNSTNSLGHIIRVTKEDFEAFDTYDYNSIKRMESLENELHTKLREILRVEGEPSSINCKFPSWYQKRYKNYSKARRILGEKQSSSEEGSFNMFCRSLSIPSFGSSNLNLFDEDEEKN